MSRSPLAAPSFATVVLALALGAASCNGCRPAPPAPAAPVAAATPPTVRLYIVANLAGALEPCGCVQDQLGGVDHLAAFLAAEKAVAPASLLLAAGPTFFLDPQLEPARETQERWKAEALASALGDLGLAGVAPGKNDWAAGAPALASLGEKARTTLLASNLPPRGDVPLRPFALREVGGQRVGIVGVGAPADGAAPGRAPAEAMRAGVEAARAAGARVLVGLAAVPRGEALRLAEAVPELDVLVVGKQVEGGDANDAPSPPRLVGATLVVEPSNHLQTVGVVDLVVRGEGRFADGSGVSSADAVASLARRIDDLAARISTWEKLGTVPAKDLEARRADLARLTAERAAVAAPAEPPTGNYFRWSLREVRTELGRDAQVASRMADYYRRVNEHNKIALAGRKAPPPADGASGYAGVEVCTVCHAAERKVWDRTRHAGAYTTLVRGTKEYNLDCVGCHVTGYEQPGGSTVTDNATLRGVQCEVCHGPGALHAKDPGKAGLIRRDPDPSTCVSACHHPPHVHSFDPVAKRAEVIGPGHGMDDAAPWPAWATKRADGGL